MRKVLYYWKEKKFRIEDTQEEISVAYADTLKYFNDGAKEQIAELQEKSDSYRIMSEKRFNQIIALNDKLHRRNLQIADLKKNQCPWNIVKDCKKSAV